jgi:hypothetical protein
MILLQVMFSFSTVATKFNMVAIKPGVVLIVVSYAISTSCQRQLQDFQVPPTQQKYVCLFAKANRTKRNVKKLKVQSMMFLLRVTFCFNMAAAKSEVVLQVRYFYFRHPFCRLFFAFTTKFYLLPTNAFFLKNLLTYKIFQLFRIPPPLCLLLSLLSSVITTLLG